MKYLTQKSWPPYVVGVLIGSVSLISMYTMGQKLGATSSFENLVWYLSNSGSVAPSINWQGALLLGVFIGASFSAGLSGFQPPELPSIWVERCGYKPFLRYAMAFVGGFVLILGALIGQGCITSYAFSGAPQLLSAAWLFMIMIFASGALTATLLYSRSSTK